MTYCIKCGLAAEPGKNYCPRCGSRLAGTPDGPVPTPPAILPGASIVQPTPPKECTKCGMELERHILFCPGCGTKNYVSQPDKARKGDLLIELENCSLVKLQILKNPGALLVYDDKLSFRAATAANNVVIPYSDLASVVAQSGIGFKYGIKLSSIGGKTYQVSLSECYADFYHYVISLILDYKQ